MASKKSKVLAIAFCAAVMAGIHVNPVLADGIADGISVTDGKVTVGYKDFVTNTGYEDDAKVTITNIASQDDLEATQQAVEKAQQTANEVAGQIGGLKDDVSNQGQQIGDLEAEVGMQGGQIADLKDDVAGQGQQIGDLETEVGLQGGQIADLKDDVAGQGQQIGDLETEVGLQGGQIADLKDDVAGQGQQIGDNTAAIKNHTSVIGVEDYSQLKTEYADTNYISGANDMVEADVILDREISNVNSRVDGLENRVDGLEDRIDKVGAMSAAIANLRTMGYDPAAPTEVAVGVGQYRDETGMALGLFHYPNRDFMLSLSVSTSGDEYMGGIGATWKFGRKSPEKVAEIKKAQAEADARRAEEQKLAKAEEMKKAAKEAKVQAQMERHAKMLAEQEAQA